jgi:hypothetical protein
MARKVTVKRRAWGLVVAWGVLLAGPEAVAAQASTADDEEAVLAVVRALFDGMREKDEALLRSVWHPDARLQSAGADENGNPRVTSTEVESFVAGVLAAEPYLDERTFDEEVRVDGNLATAWTPYNIFIDGEFGHCGVDAFQMVRTAEGWRILQLTDTRTREGCDPER